VTGQAGFIATVTVATAATTDQIFQVSSSNPAVAGVSNSVLIPAGSKTGGISIKTLRRKRANAGNDLGFRRRSNSLGHFDGESSSCVNHHVTLA